MKRVVFITGVAGGIGQSAAIAFSTAGWKVMGCDRQHSPGVDLDRYWQADLAEPEQIWAIANDIERSFGRLDALINNAAAQVCKPALETTLAEWDQVMAVNLRAAFLLAQTMHPFLKQSQGAIVNVSSVHALATSANIAAYAASKGGLVALTRALAIEFTRDQIRVNALLPGAVNTPMLRSGLDRGHLSGASIGEFLDALGKKTVMGRVGQPSEIAEAILFLADNEKSSFMTGQTLVVDGGATARLSTE